MKTFSLLTASLFLLGAAIFLQAETPPQMPPPPKEAEWLQKFVGEWKSTSEAFAGPENPSMKGKGSEKVTSLGGYWVVSQGSGEMGPMNMSFVLSIGYDATKKKYIGSWVDSMSSHRWLYEGTVDASGKVLTLETEGPCPMRAGVITKFREVTEFKSDDLRTFTSSMQDENGKWITLVKGEATRKK